MDQDGSEEGMGVSASPTAPLVNGAAKASPPSGRVSADAYTPGPWGIEQTRDMLWVGPLRQDGRKVDQVVVGLNIDSELTATAALRQYHNAHLIAAAPELLALALDFLNIDEVSARSKDDCRVFVDMRDWAPFIGAAKAAIAKAKG